ncbi:SDR family NAD(P)-dependent oxidoreductase [Actinoallomurus soli]|uniref:SDR family NAD(P)-dependent oxidoreductase n=1 Tax=Actinoallomurus soli TaxID=2952535 RepID=UPI002092EB9E|nr:SDR family oxidoreductase [Actinoallomurus soli]MCO5971151.1 SDR family oxidoreductase [Actinoallomurus soli]
MAPMTYRGQLTLITGASAGLGAEFARQLAARGSDLVLVARREDRLKTLAAELSDRHQVAVHTVAQNLADDRAGAKLAAELQRRGLQVTSLVNNAGFATYGPFHEEDPERIRQEIALDVAAVVDITRAFIGPLRERGDGVLINVASMAAYQATPRMAVYGATKAFVLSLTEALWAESRGTGLKVIALSPGATATEFFDVAGTTAATGGQKLQEPREVVADVFRALDRTNPPPSVAAGRRNRLMAALGRHLMTRKQMTQMIDRMTAAGDRKNA